MGFSASKIQISDHEQKAEAATMDLPAGSGAGVGDTGGCAARHDNV